MYILGHWRSGTTYLFNVMSQDKQFAYFDAVSVFTHNNFLLMGKLLRKLLAKSMPDKRPMDNIKYTTSHPSNINSFFPYFSSITLDLLNITLNLYHNTLYVFTQAFRLFVLKPPYYVITSTDCTYSHRNPKHEQHCGIAICACGLPV